MYDVGIHPTTTFRLQATKNIFLAHDFLAFSHPGWAGDAPAIIDGYTSSISRADSIVCASHHAQNELQRFFPEAVTKSTVIPWGLSTVDCPTIDTVELPRCLSNRRYIYSLAVPQPRKNFKTLLAAMDLVWEKYPELLLVVSAGGKRIRKGLDPRIIGLPRLTTTEIASLYARAECCAYPSLYEGFGMPALEAMTFGCPLLASDATALPELVGDGGLLLPPEDPSAWARALVQVVQDSELRDRLSAQGRARAAAFNIKETGRRFASLVLELAGA